MYSKAACNNAYQKGGKKRNEGEKLKQRQRMIRAHQGFTRTDQEQLTRWIICPKQSVLLRKEGGWYSSASEPTIWNECQIKDGGEFHNPIVRHHDQIR